MLTNQPLLIANYLCIFHDHGFRMGNPGGNGTCVCPRVPPKLSMSGLYAPTPGLFHFQYPSSKPGTGLDPGGSTRICSLPLSLDPGSTPGGVAIIPPGRRGLGEITLSSGIGGACGGSVISCGLLGGFALFAPSIQRAATACTHQRGTQ